MGLLWGIVVCVFCVLVGGFGLRVVLCGILLIVMVCIMGKLLFFINGMMCDLWGESVCVDWFSIYYVI